MKGKVHMFARRNPSGMRVTLCGQFFGDTGDHAARVTTSEADVTCVVCRSRTEEPAYFTGALVTGDAQPETVERQRWEYAALLDRMLAGDEVAPSPWPTWRAAVRDYVTAIDEGHSVPSTSRPERFEAIPGAQGEVPSGDHAQRNIARLMPVGRAIARAYGEAWTKADYPTTSACIAILVGRIVGRPVETRPRDPFGGPARKHRYVTRATWDAAELAAEHRGQRGGEITAGDVEKIVRHGGTAIEGELTQRDLVRVSDAWLRREERGEDVGRKRLRGWKEIAVALGVAERTAQLMLKWDPPIPVYDFGGNVIAYDDELEAWRSAHERRKGAA